jgi:16S rRNA (cytosine967-C5)-methyltransferase
MSDNAALNHAASIIAKLAPGDRADTALRGYFEAHRYLQPSARRAVSHAIFVYYRWLSWLDDKASTQKRLKQAEDLQKRFNADPKSAKPEALAIRAVPAWVWEEVALPDAEAKAAYLRQLQRDPALWLRARPGQAKALIKSLAAGEPADISNFKSQIANGETDAVRFTGVQDLFKTEQFKTGEFEIQDLASQLVGVACAPKPGETWWDTCAGEGGKTLHLCDLMQNKGVVWASDRHSGRLETLKRRTARAKLFNYRAALWDGSPRLPTKAKFDGILVDAPCSGVGTWQRNPQARWTTSLEDVTELAATQLALLNQVAGSLKPGGRLVYSVCTLTRRETTAVADAFAAAHPELEPAPVFAGAPSPNSQLPSSIVLWPHALNANGMFIAAWRRKKA